MAVAAVVAVVVGRGAGRAGCEGVRVFLRKKDRTSLYAGRKNS